MGDWTGNVLPNLGRVFRVKQTLQPADYFLTTIAPHSFILARKKGEICSFLEYVPGTGGDVWFMRHSNDGQTAIYLDTELETIDD